jgi:hypothetical protein
MIGKRKCLALCALTAALLSLFVGSTAFAATITVNSLADPGQLGVCALRDAITAANTKTATNGCAAGSRKDTIDFLPRITGTILLVSTLPEVTDSLLTINGPASRSLTISGNFVLAPVMEVAAGATLNLNNLPIAHGSTLIEVAAGATVNLNNVSIAGGLSPGGGIENAGTLTVANSVFSGNESLGSGGGILNRGVLTVTSSTFSGNSGDGGGGIDNDVGSTSTVTNSTFSANTTSHGVGAVFNGGTLTVINSTFFGNRCMHACPGAISNAGVLTVTNSTFSSNMGEPGGIANVLGLGSVSLKSTILANSMFPPPPVGLPSVNCGGTITDVGYNISDDSSCGFAKTGSANNGDGVNPLLSASGLANNGGPTQTIAPQSGSPAIDAIPVSDCTDQASPPNLITDDQRGFPRPDAGERVCDIGAYEFESFAGQPGARSCQTTSVAVLTEQFGSLDAAASALGFSSVNALQSAIQAFCKG